MHSLGSFSASPGHLCAVPQNYTNHFLPSVWSISNSLSIPEVLLRTFKKVIMWLCIHPPTLQSKTPGKTPATCYISGLNERKPTSHKSCQCTQSTSPWVKGGETKIRLFQTETLAFLLIFTILLFGGVCMCFFFFSKKSILPESFFCILTFLLMCPTWL